MNDFTYKNNIKDALSLYGIFLNVNSGSISYTSKRNNFSLDSHSLWFMRHGSTMASESNCFMSETSNNSILTDLGIKTVKKSIKSIEFNNFDIILYSPIPRVIETVDIIKKYTQYNNFECLEFMKGIDNASWAGLKISDFNAKQIFDYSRREIYHDVFAKAEGGTCWGDVLMNCIKLIKYINTYLKNKDVLLVSQESILWGIKIILHLQNSPWENYVSTKVFNLDIEHQNNTYGQLFKIQ